MQIKEILEFLKLEGCRFSFYGEEHQEIGTCCSLDDIKESAITWRKGKERLTQDVINTMKARKTVLIVSSGGVGECPEADWIITENPKAVFFKTVNHFFGRQPVYEISQNSVIETKHIGKNVAVGHHCYINAEVEIGEGTVIGHNVTMTAPCKIGKRTTIHSGAVIGTDGFGYYEENGLYLKVPHFGGVMIGDDVEIGANTCIDRGTIGDTVIGSRVKIDNLCHIAHNVQIAEDSMVIAFSMLGGSCKLKEKAYIAPGGIVKNQITVGKHAVVGMGAVVIKEVEDYKVVAGVPAKVLRDNR